MRGFRPRYKAGWRCNARFAPNRRITPNEPGAKRLSDFDGVPGDCSVAGSRALAAREPEQRGASGSGSLGCVNRHVESLALTPRTGLIRTLQGIGRFAPAALLVLTRPKKHAKFSPKGLRP